ncbi:MAG: 3-deoxy-D-manno-octulosonic acid transferase [Candidatus Omnitrophica bacterium]|nr:3-deoxy-D-manno-octulosonic acid transferase [Candidatus Omnitrophota bacterium]
MWWVYELLFILGYLAYLPKALMRKRLPHPGWTMRLGYYPQPARDVLRRGVPIWVHAVSVGEVLAARPLVRAIAEASVDPLILSTITRGGFDVASTPAIPQTIPLYLPLDLRGCVRRAFDQIRPRVLILIESELWPILIREAKARGCRIAVVNGRISARAFRRYRWVRRWLGGALSRHIDFFCMQSQQDADRLTSLGVTAEKVRVAGNLKWEASLSARPTPEQAQETAGTIGVLPGDQLIVAGSTHRGEEAALLAAIHELKRAQQPIRLIIAPRHLERVAEVESLVKQAGLISLRFSQARGGGGWDVGIVDTFGQLPRYYALATVVFIGGSLIPHGGQNPLEAASLGKPVFFGPHMHNFADIAEQLLAADAAKQLATTEELLATLTALLTNPASAEAMGRRAQALAERSRGAVTRTLEALQPIFQSISDMK